jgi:hypothetical protein
MDTKEHSRKRKQTSGEHINDVPFHRVVGLEMMSDEEDQEFDGSSDDGQVDEFPGIDTRSDSEGDSDEDGDAGEGQGDDEDQEDPWDSDESDLHIFPKAKTVVSDITGHTKSVYPEIEPEYDSDSSTEDVWSLIPSTSLSKYYFRSHLTVLVIYQCIGMTIYPMSVTILMERKYYGLLEAMNLTSSWKQSKILRHGQLLLSF